MGIRKSPLFIFAIIAYFFLGIAIAQTGVFKDIAPKEASGLIKKNSGNPNFVIMDVRTPEEYREGYIENSVNINYLGKTFRNAVLKLDRTKIYLLYCRSGRRSKEVQDIMKGLGFKEVYNMPGGILQWQAEGLKIKK
ncbi:MAG TPA: rhodanese-like domain-containing protein [Thermodesulfobacteriota bacterium]|nr:rhodanese-like domain-containing protein [Thermodesulfobacteriota bacterium]